MEMNYDEIMDRVSLGLGEEAITDEEWDFAVQHLQEKLANKEEITAHEINEIILECANLEYDYGEPTRHGWIYTTIIFTFDEKNYYSFDCWWHDDHGIDGIDNQVCPRMIKKPVMVEKWVEAEEGE